MAKKKTDSTGASPAGGARKRSTSSKAKQTAKPAKGAPTGGTPLIDTAQAAVSVARMLATRAKLHDQVELATGERESGSFKQLKEGLTKHPSMAAASSLNSALGVSKSNLPPTGARQSAHNQTLDNVARVNVPRRTVG